MLSTAIVRKIERFDVANPEELSQLLVNQAFRKPGAIEKMTQGFVSPFTGDLPDSDLLYVKKVHTLWVLSFRCDRKLLPPAIVNDAVRTKKRAMELELGRKVARGVERKLKEEVEKSLLESVIPKPTRIDVVIDIAKGVVILGTHQAATAEEIIVQLMRSANGRILIKPPEVSKVILGTRQLIADWVSGRATLPEKWSVGGDLKLAAIVGNGKISYANEDATHESVIQYLNEGHYPQEIGLEIEGHCSFALTTGLVVKRLKVFKGQGADNHGEDTPETDDVQDASLILAVDAIVTIKNQIEGLLVNMETAKAA